VPDVFDILSDEARRGLRKTSQPDWTSPMLATLTRDTFSDPEWIYERKLDGVRCLAFHRGRGVHLLSRNRKPMNDTYPELVDALRSQRFSRFIVDGEIVAFEGRRTSFSRLQQRIGIRDPDVARGSGIAVRLYLFDLVHLEGRDVSKLALRDRKRLLKRALAFEDPIRFTPHRVESGEAYLEEACAKGWEGLIAKRASSPYQHSRSRDWLKFKCGNRQELVIGGFTDPKGSRKGFGALLVGYYEKGELRYAGKVGTGYDDETLESLGERLRSIERETCPFEGSPREKGAHWVSPKLVGEVGFTEWTGDGKLRHPRFLGLRTDKRPKQVKRERPERAPV
jgi:bifunctional non-homologous end joining protein LigD